MNDKQLEKLNSLFSTTNKFDKLLQELTVTKIDAYYEENDRVYGIDHALNTAQIALKIANHFESCDRTVVMFASLFHDVDRDGCFDKSNHGENGANLTKHILQEMDDSLYNRLKVKFFLNSISERISSCIARHSFSNRCNDPSSLTIEEKIVFDADKIELFGYHGIVRLIAYADQSMGRITALDNIRKEYDRKLKLIPDSLYLSVSQDILKEQMVITQQFMEYI